MGWLEELINKAIEGQDKEIESCRESIEWHEKGAKDGRYKRDVAQARKNELVEALAKLYPPVEPRKWDSANDVPDGVAVRNKNGSIYKWENGLRYMAYSGRENGEIRWDRGERVESDGNRWMERYSPFTEVLEGAK